MKKLKVLAMMFCIAAMGLTASCSKEPKDLILGKWEVTSVAGRTNHYLVGGIWTFSADETISMSVDGRTFNGTYYLVNDEKITISVDNNPFTVTIEELTKSRMIWMAPTSINDEDVIAEVVLKKK